MFNLQIHGFIAVLLMVFAYKFAGTGVSYQDLFGYQVETHRTAELSPALPNEQAEPSATELFASK